MVFAIAMKFPNLFHYCPTIEDVIMAISEQTNPLYIMTSILQGKIMAAKLIDIMNFRQLLQLKH